MFVGCRMITASAVGVSFGSVADFARGHVQVSHPDLTEFLSCVWRCPCGLGLVLSAAQQQRAVRQVFQLGVIPAELCAVDRHPCLAGLGGVDRLGTDRLGVGVDPVELAIRADRRCSMLPVKPVDRVLRNYSECIDCPGRLGLDGVLTDSLAARVHKRCQVSHELLPDWISHRGRPFRPGLPWRWGDGRCSAADPRIDDGGNVARAGQRRR
jgi:hypothetical protein